ncbi:ATP-binding protein [Roseateles sp. DAIF2]|uniref:ATP-binding protein n=1 Tax=Roseateles sp. DAIF2 TaxID=2714952 RepID=UPI0018A2D120|nr:ATP-binding protein [Roseateles sp. DAIF2]QPF73981.1 ATP-binding protein [Roseateles sp. DAIF2]
MLNQAITNVEQPRTAHPRRRGAQSSAQVSSTQQQPADKAAAQAATNREIRRAALEQGEARDKLYMEHPVTKNEVAVATPPLKEAYSIIESVVVHRDPGTCLLGDFRSGKTTTIKRTVCALNETFRNLPVGKALAKDHDKFTQGTFFSDLLQDAAHSGAQRGTAQEKRTRYLNMLIGQARELASDRYLVLVDEGQNWGESQWTWLRDVANDLNEKSIRLITVTFGQTSELKKLRSNLLSRGRTDLIGRFLLTPREFRGLRDVEELRETLKAYDDPEQSAHPIGTDISYAEFFMPKSWKSGWRLADEADRMWNEFKAIAVSGNKVAGNIGMNWIGGAVRNFLFAQMELDGPGYAGTPGAWKAAVQFSGYGDTLF